MLFLIHNAARNNAFGTFLSPLADSKISERPAYALITSESLVLNTVPFAQQLFANYTGSHSIAGIHAMGLAEISKVQTAGGTEKAVTNTTTEHPSLKGKGEKGQQVVRGDTEPGWAVPTEAGHGCPMLYRHQGRWEQIKKCFKM